MSKGRMKNTFPKPLLIEVGAIISERMKRSRVWMGFYEMFVIYIGSNDKSLQKIIMGNIII